MHGFLNRGALKGLENYIIPLTGQKLGEHIFNYQVQSAFIDAFEDSDILTSDVSVEVKLIRNNQTFNFDFHLNGSLEVTCDRCLESLQLEIEHNAKLLVKFADQYEEINDELITIREEDSDFDLAPVIYEYLMLSIPIRKVHNEGECDPNMINMLDQLTPEEKTDSRWDDLKKLLNNN